MQALPVAVAVPVAVPVNSLEPEVAPAAGAPADRGVSCQSMRAMPLWSSVALMVNAPVVSAAGAPACLVVGVELPAAG